MPILRKKLQQEGGYKVKVEGDQAANPPPVFTWVRTHRTSTGEDMSARVVDDAIPLSEEKCCSVGALPTTLGFVPARETALVGAWKGLIREEK